jgi:hypothetical protein
MLPFKKEFASLRTKLDDARMASVPVLERYFKKAQRKIGQGHYKFQADATSGKQQTGDAIVIPLRAERFRSFQTSYPFPQPVEMCRNS